MPARHASHAQTANGSPTRIVGAHGVIVRARRAHVITAAHRSTQNLKKVTTR